MNYDLLNYIIFCSLFQDAFWKGSYHLDITADSEEADAPFRIDSRSLCVILTCFGSMEQGLTAARQKNNPAPENPRRDSLRPSPVVGATGLDGACAPTCCRFESCIRQQ